MAMVSARDVVNTWMDSGHVSDAQPNSEQTPSASIFAPYMNKIEDRGAGLNRAAVSRLCAWQGQHSLGIALLPICEGLSRSILYSGACPLISLQTLSSLTTFPGILLILKSTPSFSLERLDGDVDAMLPSFGPLQLCEILELLEDTCNSKALLKASSDCWEMRACTASLGGIQGFLARSLQASSVSFSKFRHRHSLDRSSSDSFGWDCGSHSESKRVQLSLLPM